MKAEPFLSCSPRRGQTLAHSNPRLSHGRVLWELGLITGAIIALTLATILGRPEQRGESVTELPALRAILLDASDSVTLLHPSWPRQAGRFLREQCQLAAELGEQIMLVEYALEARRSFGPGSADELASHLDGRRNLLVPGESVSQIPNAGGGSELDAALAVASGPLLAPGRTQARLVLFTDTTYTGHDPSPALARLARSRVQVEWHDLPVAELSRVTIDQIHVPEWTPAGSPLAVRVDLLWQGAPPSERGTGLNLAWSLEGRGGPATGEHLIVPPEGVPIACGGLRWSVHVDLPTRLAGDHSLALRLSQPQAARSRPLPSATGSAVIEVGDLVRVGLVEPPGPSLLGPGWDGLESAGVALRRVSPAEVLSVLPQVDVLLSLDVEPAQLPGPALEAFVRSGGGWLALMGWRFLGSWVRPELDHPPLGAAGLLPLVPAADTGRGRDVVLLVDGSGSMEGQPFERVREALFELVPAALPADRLELRFFNELLGPVAFRSSGRTPAERRQELAPLLQAKVPSGGTDILYALGQLAASRSPTDAPGLALLLSDGHSTAVSGVPASEVRARLTRARLDLKILVVGDHPNRGCLPDLLGPGESWVEAGDLSHLGELLHLEVNRRRVQSAPSQRARPGEPTDPLAQSILAAQGGVGAVELLAVPTCARAEAVAGAQVLWVREPGGEPLLAMIQHGLGWVGTLASGPSGGWAPELVTGPGSLLPMILALGKATRDSQEPPRLRALDGRLELSGAQAHWPDPLTCEIRPPLPEVGQVAADPIAVVHLTMGMGGSDLDPRLRRLGPVPTVLGRLPRGGNLEARLLGPNAVLASLSLAAPGNLEWSGAARPISRNLPPPGPAVAAALASPHPLAVWLLGLGLLLGFAGGLASLRRGHSQFFGHGTLSHPS